MEQDTVHIRIKFISIMQKHVGKRREVEMDLPSDPGKAVDFIIKEFQIPWHGNLEKFVRIFINRERLPVFIESGKKLTTVDTIAFIPMSGGG